MTNSPNCTTKLSDRDNANALDQEVNILNVHDLCQINVLLAQKTLPSLFHQFCELKVQGKQLT